MTIPDCRLILSIKMMSFDDLFKKVQSVHDLVLSKMGCANQDHSNDELEFSKRLYEIKCWFIRISWKNKKRFVLDLLDDITSMFTLSVLLKSIWNARSKDAILSISEYKTWSSYDQVPLDHDRTVLMSSIQDAIKSYRKWFRALHSAQQCLALAELLSVAGGPIIWEVFKTAEKIYEQNVEQEMENLVECVVVNEPPQEKKPIIVEALDTNLALWATTIKAMKDSLKLEELEMTFNDGTQKRIWKVNRLKPDNSETVDFIQLLPSALSKRILLHLPLSQLSDCARVNKYWAYLVDEFRAELIARQKIDIELEKLRENMLRHEDSVALPNDLTELKIKSDLTSHAKIKDTNAYFNKPYPYCLVLEMNKAKQRRIAKVSPSFRNMTDLNNRLVIRGAADKNIRKLCENICKINENNKGPEVCLNDGT
ncbi:uncharacterized protein LOC124529789 [Vanessa cardui]|uniref:uncharacterized protein LOC124529789 n=1 Tax=Vanessa cardui TaxID=171605 RepID=UPI001F13CB20|nr:uncharacterized protein LOC124529789 [Vanessa cardui]